MRWWAAAVTVGMLSALAPGAAGEAPQAAAPTALLEFLAEQAGLTPEFLSRATVTQHAVPGSGEIGVVYDPAANLLSGAPGAPTALPAFPPRETGCAGVGPSVGFMVEPSGVAGVAGGCPFRPNIGPPHSSYLACAAPPTSAATCFLTATKTDFFNFGIYSFFCNVSQGASVGHANWQSGIGFNQNGCTTFVFGSHPNTWATWIGTCGGFGAGVVWKCSDLIR